MRGIPFRSSKHPSRRDGGSISDLRFNVSPLQPLGDSNVMASEQMSGICGRCGKGAHLEGPFRVCNGCLQVASACKCVDIMG